QRGFQGVDALPQRAATSTHGRRELTLLLHPARIRLRGLVALTFERIELAGERPAAHVERFQLVEQSREARVAAPGERRAHLLRRGAKQLEVDHRAYCLGNPGARPR